MVARKERQAGQQAARRNWLRRWTLAGLSLPACLLLAIPFVALLRETTWASLGLPAGDRSAVYVSIGLGLLSLLLIIVLGTPLALWLSRTSHPGRRLVEAIVLAALLTPPLAMGILLAAAYGPYGMVGFSLASLGLLLTNNIGAFVLAQLYGGLAYYVLSARAAFDTVPRDAEEAAQTLGATSLQILRRVTLPLARAGLMTGMALAWVRIIGEFGIVMIVAYFPQGLPVRMYVNLQNDGVEAVYTLVWILLLSTLPFPMWALAKGRRVYARAAAGDSEARTR